MAEVLREMYGLKIETKWPNDVLVSGRKVCGILTEMNSRDERVNYVIVGVGVNGNFDLEKVFSEELKKVATSLETELGRKVMLEELFRALLEKLENVYGLFLNEGFVSILGRWKEYAGFLGNKVEVTSGTEKYVGLALDVESDGSLLIRLEDGTEKRFFVGDVSLQRK